MERRFVATVGGQGHEVTVEPLDGGAFRVTVDGRSRVVDARRVGAGTWSLVARGGGPARLVDVDGVAPELAVTIEGRTAAIQIEEGRRAIAAAVATARSTSGPLAMRAPMPGKVVKVLAGKGDVVKAGQGVVVIEAMKMENELRAPRDGTIVEVGIAEGQAVEAGQVLATIA
jgi:biotin carboxyl carrier protein